MGGAVEAIADGAAGTAAKTAALAAAFLRKARRFTAGFSSVAMTDTSPSLVEFLYHKWVEVHEGYPRPQEEYFESGKLSKPQEASSA
jgi:hypothetical protein